MVYSATLQPTEGGILGMLSSTEVMKILGITKITLYKWADRGKLKARRYKIGTKTYYAFDQKDVDALKARMVKTRKQGKSLIRE